MKPPLPERLWIVASSILLLAAVVFLWRNNLSAAFVTGTLGAVAWFLSYRAKLRTAFVRPDDNSIANEVNEEFDQD